MCGCLTLLQVDKSTRRMAQDERELHIKIARERQEVWGCPSADPPVNTVVELTPTEQDEDVYAARIMGSKPCGTCPFAEQFIPSPWAASIFRAATLCEDYGVDVETALEREPMRIDLEALAVLTRARAQVTLGDEEFRKGHT